MALAAAELAVVSRLLDEALALMPADRERWLQALPAEHAHLVAVMREMLARAETTSSLLLDQAPRLPERRDSENSAPNVGDRVGPYELVRELGAGGMAHVWLARRADGAYRRDVALKLPRLLRSRTDFGRLFARERDILAGLEHPNIARLYDAGVGPEQVPYIAMEYVQGQPVTVWCDTHRVGLRERLMLFQQVLDAVQYAHARKVVHRDLKPSNILVTEAGQARLLDFGIAKLLSDEEVDRTSIHAYTRALTPEYASPELLRGDPVEPASDVYSLGAILYELLCGNRPYSLAPVVSAAQLARAIDAVQLTPPSARVAPDAGIARSTTQDRLAGRLRGDLDALALKALARDPADRYLTAAALADDVRRYLVGERVQAAPDRLSADELVAALARNPKVRVRPRRAESSLPGGNRIDRAAATVPAPLGTGALPGSSMALRLTVQLTGAADARVLWSQSFDVGRGRPQGDLERRLARALQAALDALASDAEGGKS